MVQAVPTHGSPQRNLFMALRSVSGDFISKPPPLYKVRLNGIITITVTIQGWNVNDCEVTVFYDKDYLKIVQGSDRVIVPVTVEGNDVSWSFQALKQSSALEIQFKATKNGLSQQIYIPIEVL